MDDRNSDRHKDLWMQAESEHPRSVCRCGYRVLEHWVPKWAVFAYGRPSGGICDSPANDAIEARYDELVAAVVACALVGDAPRPNQKPASNAYISRGLIYNGSPVYASRYAPGRPRRGVIELGADIVDMYDIIISPTVSVWESMNPQDLSWGADLPGLRAYFAARIRIPAPLSRYSWRSAPRPNPHPNWDVWRPDNEYPWSIVNRRKPVIVEEIVDMPTLPPIHAIDFRPRVPPLLVFPKAAHA